MWILPRWGLLNTPFVLRFNTGIEMATLMNQDEFRTALEQAIKGNSANRAPFSVA